MKKFAAFCVAITFLVILLGFSLTTQAGLPHADPAVIKVVSVEKPLTIDGVLDENDWTRRFDYLVFNADTVTGDVEYAPTGGVYITGAYTDTTTTYVKIMHDGLDLYIALDSDDESVCKFGTSWEGDGLFMKVKDANGNAQEFKLYFNLSGVDPDIAFETPGSYPNSGEGAAVKKDGTIVNDTTQTDAGYTAEMVIHLDELGYTDPYSKVEVAINIFDPDNYCGTDDPYKATGVYYKQWWGSEWGSEFRTLKLVDPPTKTAYATTGTITLDGQLNEDFWVNAESVIIGVDAGGTGGYYAQWGDTLNSYTDRSNAVLKFMHNGTDLYIGMVSDDKSVCSWSTGWEADGLFLYIANYGSIPSAAERMEIKTMYFSGGVGDSAVFELSSTVPSDAAEGVSYEPGGTVTHTETNGEDAGYSLEVVIHTADFDYMVGDTVMLSACVWDLDYGSADAMQEGVSDYAPNWWGTQWCDPTFEKYFMYRGVILSPNENAIDKNKEQLITDFKLYPNVPNPFNPTTTIAFRIPENSQVRLDIYNILGQQVKTLVNTNLSQGYHSVIWDGKTQKGQPAPSGIYFYRLSAGQNVKVAKMVLSK